MHTFFTPVKCKIGIKVKHGQGSWDNKDHLDQVKNTIITRMSYGSDRQKSFLSSEYHCKQYKKLLL